MEPIILKRAKQYERTWPTRHTDNYISFMVITQLENMPSNRYVAFYYHEELEADFNNRLSQVGEERLAYPMDYTFIKKDTIENIIANESKNSRYGYGNNPKYKVEEEKTIDDYGLYIPSFYKNTEYEVETTYNEGLTDDMKEQLNKSTTKKPIIVIGEDLSKAKANQAESILKFYCTKCGNTYFYHDAQYSENSEDCPYCKNRKNHDNILVTKDFKLHREKEYNQKSRWAKVLFSNYPITNKETFYYATQNKNNTGVAIYKITKDIAIKKNKIMINYNIEFTIEHKIGEPINCTKYLKKSTKKVDVLTALNINTKNILNPPPIIYENADNFFQFAVNNEEYFKRAGFLSLLKYSNGCSNLEAFYIIFLVILDKYPTMEQIIKIGQARLYYKLYNAMISCYNKNEINECIEQLSLIVNNDATKAKDVLRFPEYIGNYLTNKNADIDEYYYWRDIYELTNISKENFIKFTEGFNYAFVYSQCGLKDICNILKYNYPLEKLFSYLIKQKKMYPELDLSEIITYLTDYLTMCDFLQVKPDMFPQNIKKQHDDMTLHYAQSKQAEFDKSLTVIGVECEKYVIPDAEEMDKIGIPKSFEKYTVVFPKNEKDFINEGNQQHNCVGSYPRRVKNGERFVFFIREKEHPHQSFITADCNTNGLYQCLLSNNRTVNNEEIMKFARYIANKIVTGCRSGKIHGLNNVVK